MSDIDKEQLAQPERQNHAESDGDRTGLFRSESERGGIAAKNLPKDPPPRAANRSAQEWRCCEQCETWFAAPCYRVAKGEARWCSRSCLAAHRKATGAQAGANNPRWLGGVSNDSMRYRRRARAKAPEKERARSRLAYAVRRGYVARQPCACGAPIAEAHHDDYSKPLDVRWLCRACHVAEHRGAKVA